MAASCPHSIVNPPTLAAPVGFSHAVSAAPGRTIYVGGQTALSPDGTIGGQNLVEQFDQALANVVEALRAASAHPEHVVSMVVYTTDIAEYRASLSELGVVYRRHLGRHYPAMALFGVSELFDPESLVELLSTAVVPQ